jgi:hypothetical protein
MIVDRLILKTILLEVREMILVKTTNKEARKVRVPAAIVLGLIETGWNRPARRRWRVPGASHSLELLELRAGSYPVVHAPLGSRRADLSKASTSVRPSGRLICRDEVRLKRRLPSKRKG